MKHLTILFAAACLTACTTGPKPGIAIGPNGPVAPGKKAILGQDLPSGPRLGSTAIKDPHKLFEALYQQSYCTEFPSTNTVVKAGANCASYKYPPGATPPKPAVAMLNSGFAYSELLCDRYFNLLANRNQDLGFGIQGVGLAGGFTNAVLGFTGAPSKSIALVAAGFSSTIAGMESYQQNYHFGPDVHAVRKLIMNGQASYQTTITNQSLSTLTHYQAISHLKRHQAICQVDTIKSWVTAAVQRQEIRFENDPIDNFLSNSSMRDAADKVRTEAGITGAFPTSQLGNLLWLYEMTPSPAIIKNHIQPSLGNELTAYFLSTSTDGAGKKSYALQYNSEIANILINLSANSRNGLQKIVAIRRQKAKESPDVALSPDAQKAIEQEIENTVQQESTKINVSIQTIGVVD